MNNMTGTPNRDETRERQEENAKYVIDTPIPDKFDWNGKGDEPEWFQSYMNKKAGYVKKVAKKYGRLPDTIMFWKLEMIKERFPLD